jgi:predicted PurR-regulated permease PerM
MACCRTSCSRSRSALTLDLNPLVVLIATIGSGCIFGMVGLVLGAPLTSAALHISRELAAAKEREAAEEAGRAPPSGAQPEPAST